MNLRAAGRAATVPGGTFVRDDRHLRDQPTAPAAAPWRAPGFGQPALLEPLQKPLQKPPPTAFTRA